MATRRKITTKKPMFGNNRPFSLKATRRQRKPNLQWKAVFVPEMGETVRVRVSAREIRTIDKIGLKEFLARQGKTLAQIL